MTSHRICLAGLLAVWPLGSVAQLPLPACSDCATTCNSQYVTCAQSACWAAGGTLGPMSVCTAAPAATGVTPDYQKRIQMCASYQQLCANKCQAPACK